MNCLPTLQSLLFLINTITIILANEQLNFKCENRYHNCLDISKCEPALTALRFGVIPKICGFKESTSYVCCSEENQIEYFPVKTKSEEQCEKYYGKLSENPASGIRKSAHVVTLGAKTNNSIEWVCGGSLISDEFILTAAHCLSSIHGDVNLVRFQHSINAQNKQKTFDTEIVKIITHPQYTSHSFYYDIALVKIAKLDINSQYKPACLHHHKFLPPFKRLKVSGYGVDDESNTSNKQLRQVSLNVIGYKECNAFYEKIKSSKLEIGIDDQSQICAGQRAKKNTYHQSESGRPLEYKDFSETMRPHFMIVGIASFDKSKEFPGQTSSKGVYTRVSKYLPWIEENVWPDEN